MRQLVHYSVENHHLVVVILSIAVSTDAARMGQINTKGLRENIEGSVWR